MDTRVLLDSTPAGTGRGAALLLSNQHYLQQASPTEALPPPTREGTTHIFASETLNEAVQQIG